MPAGPDFSALERHLFKITSQIEALQRPDGIEQSIAAFRGELAEIRHAITEAMPRRAIESIENEIRSLSRRIDDTRQSGTDAQALAGIERALGEIREVLRSLTPAEQLAGYDEAIRNLGAKLDLILRANDDPSTVQQLEGAIAALRAIVSNVASNDALARLSDDVHTLSSKVDQLGRSESNSDSFAILEQRIAALTSTLESRERPAASENSEHLEGALRALSDRSTACRSATTAPPHSPISNSACPICSSASKRPTDHRATGNLGRVEDGLQDILRHLETQHATVSPSGRAANRGAAEPPDTGLIDIVKRELSDIRFSQSETDRHTQDSLEAVHNTLGHVVDRLAMIEGDLRTVRSAPAAAARPRRRRRRKPRRRRPPPRPAPRCRRNQSPNCRIRPRHRSILHRAPREFHAASPAPPLPRRWRRAPSAKFWSRNAAPPRPAIEPDLPPDHPLEPGTRPTGRLASPSERIAASESAISEIPAGTRETGQHIEFHCRRAPCRPGRRRRGTGRRQGRPRSAEGLRRRQGQGTLDDHLEDPLAAGRRQRGRDRARHLQDGDDAARQRQPAATAGHARIRANRRLRLARPPKTAPSRPCRIAATPSMTSPTPIGRQSFNSSAPTAADSTVSVAIPQITPAPAASPSSSSDVTGTIPAAQTAPAGRKLGLVQVPPTERLPDAIGGPVLRAAALKGDPTAAYEIGLRFAEGKGVAPNFDEAAKWYDRAAQAGVVPAIFRLGTLYEKGLSVKKDADIARRYYLQAAERGNAKAMHNLAVLDADGGGKGANYKNASQWFRKAADRGVADSQFNLGILYARGIGVEQNLAESFKWFSLAAAQGDADAVRKRDDIAKRLDPQSLAAAKLAIQTFTPEPQPDDAVNVATPAGGWDIGTGAGRYGKARSQAGLTKRAAAAH